jgi:hypothetical protein
MFKEYFRLNVIGVVYGGAVDIPLIEEALRKGYAVVVPANGRLLKEGGYVPWYTGVGPDRNMYIVDGFDNEGYFYVNDPGTARGRKIRILKTFFFTTIGDYPSGKDVPITDARRKAAIIVGK